MRRSIATALRIATKGVDRDPSDAEKEAGNYKKGHVTFRGMGITIENPKGATRSGVDKGGKKWSCVLPAHYGYIKGSVGADKDHVDVYLGPDHNSDKVFVVDQVNAETKKFDEHKAMLSYGSKVDAVADYQKAFSDGKGKDRIGAVTEMSVDDFKSWLKHEDTTKALGALKRATGGAIPFPGDAPGYASGGSPSIEAIIQAAAAQYGIDPSIMRAFAGIESGYNPNAVKGSYRGLYQMSGDEFSKYGGTGNIFDPTANANAAAQKFKADIADFNQQYGRYPTAAELYERHQQGVGGAGAHWARPDAPAWENMYSTGEGRQKGAGWAQQAISGNMLPEWKKQYDPNTITSGQFTQLWNDRVNKFAGLPGTTNPVESVFGGASAPKDAQPVGLTSVAPVANVPKETDSGSWFSNLFDGSPSSPASPSSDAKWVEGPLGLMPKWGDDATALQGYAGGGEVPPYPGDDPDFLSMLANNPHGWGNSAPLPVWDREPLDFQGEISNSADRPSDPFATPIAESISPTMGAYGAGQAAGETVNALRDQDWGKAAEFGLPLAAMAMGVPGVKGVRGVPRELNEAGFYSPSLEAAKGLPQESGTLQQMRSMLLNAGAKPKELEAVGFDTAFPDPAAKVSRGQIEEFLRGNRVGLGNSTYLDNAPTRIIEGGEPGGPRLYEDEGSGARYRYEPVNNGWQISNNQSGETKWFKRSDEALMALQEMANNAKAAGPSKFEQYSTPGGIPGSYREVVTTLPGTRDRSFKAFAEAEYGAPFEQLNSLQQNQAREMFDAKAPMQGDYTSSHWPGVTNPLLHYRTKDFPGGTRVMDELQSDWAQRARDQGTMTPEMRQQLEADAAAKGDAYSALVNETAQKYGWELDKPLSTERNAAELAKSGDPAAVELNNNLLQAKNDWISAETKTVAAQRGVPPAPFIGNTSDWVDLGLKQVLSDAVKDPSVTRLAWAPGKEHIRRYPHLGGTTNAIEYRKNPSGDGYDLSLQKGSRGEVIGENVKAEDLAQHVGADTAKRIIALEGKPVNYAANNEHPNVFRRMETPGLQYKTSEGVGMGKYYGDFTPEGSYTPGIVGTRLLKILKGMDPDAKIEPHHIRDIKGSKGYSGREGEGSVQDYFNAPVPPDTPVHYPSVAITPKMREAIKKGLPLFLGLGAAGMGEYNGSTAPDHGPFDDSGAYPAPQDVGRKFARGGAPFPGDVAKLTDRPPTSDEHRVPYNPAVDPWPENGPPFDLVPQPKDVPPPAPGNMIAHLLQRYVFNGRPR